ncbi:MAG TPA: cellulase family glycosylhydrolase, partial [bacterium]|nr:cellulase family glycosylhydrolase [bacterium]
MRISATLAAAFFAVASLAISGCRMPSAFVHSGGELLRKGWSSFTPRGAAVMDDSTLWDPSKNSPAEIGECDWTFAASGEMNVARLAVKADYFVGEGGEEKPEGLEWLGRQLAAAERAGLLVLVDMHIPPGGAVEDYRQTDENAKFWASPKLMGRFVDAWRAVASRYRHDRRVMGYELMNEPSGDPGAYWKLMDEAAQAIRGVDRNHLIVVQPASDGLLRRFKDGNFAYSIHFYAPLSFTH